MKLKTNSAAKKPETSTKIKSPKKQSKGVEVRKEKSKNVVKPAVLKKEAKKSKPDEVSASPKKTLQQELWFKAIDNVSNKSNLSDEESNIAKLLSNYKKKSSVPLRKIKLQNFITKGFSKYKETSEETFNGLYDKLLEEFKAVGGIAETVDTETKTKKSEKKIVKTKTTNEEASDDDEMDVGDEKDDVNDEDESENDDDEVELDISDDDIEEESEEEKQKPIAKKGNNKNGKSLPNKAKNGSKFKSGKVQKNKKFGKKK